MTQVTTIIQAGNILAIEYISIVFNKLVVGLCAVVLPIHKPFDTLYEGDDSEGSYITVAITLWIFSVVLMSRHDKLFRSVSLGIGFTFMTIALTLGYAKGEHNEA